jgi:hypothetical protein
MPIHDWTRVDASLFHNFSLGWVAELCRRLNQGLLPSSHYAMSETMDYRPAPGFIDLPEPKCPFEDPGYRGEVWSVGERPPQTALRFVDGRVEYANRVVTIRDCDTHRVAAALFLVAESHKRTRSCLDAFVRRAVGAISHGIHLVVIDLLPPTPRDPEGTQPAIWGEFADDPSELPPGKTLTLASYDAGPPRAAYVDFVAVGDTLPDIPLFLAPDVYVSVPLEATYQAAWEPLPASWRNLLTSGDAV